MRHIDLHKINPVNDTLDIVVLDPPGAGGASHEYSVQMEGVDICTIKFQNGPINEHGVNGVTQEILAAIVIDRLRSFQRGDFSCRENAIALTKFEEGLQWLQSRTLERMRRGVEGKTKA